MGIDFFFGRWDLLFARQREKKFRCLLGVFLVFLLFFEDVFVLFGVFFLVFFSASA